MAKNKAKVVVEEGLAIDAIAMKRRIQAEIYEETKDMNAEELIEYFRKRVAESEFAEFFSRPSQSTTDDIPTDKANNNDEALTPDPRQK